MNPLKKLQLVKVDIDFIPPKNLEALAKRLEGERSKKLLDFKSSFEFPPKPINKIIELFMKASYDNLNFFDIVRLLMLLEKDELDDKINDKLAFTEHLQKLFNQKERYIKHIILKRVTKILKKEHHSFKNSLEHNLTSKEFFFIRKCIEKNFTAIEKIIKNKSLRKVLKYYGLHKILADTIEKYSNYLLEHIARKISEETVEKYQNNLLYEDDIDLLYNQVDKLVSIMKHHTNIMLLVDKVLINKLGYIEDSNSKWHTLLIPLDIQDNYKRLKGLFEFQRFVVIADYLAKNTNLSSSNPSPNGNTTDATRILNRSIFWSNYDSRFSSVKMWVTDDDYNHLSRDIVVDLNDIETVQDFDNEVCMLEFKKSNLLIIEFFRLKDQGSSSRKSLVFDNDIAEIKDLLDNYNLNLDLISELKSRSTYQINHIHLWQGWVDKFLRERNIYPNESILNSKNKFKSHRKLTYMKSVGLEETRKLALEKGILYNDVIILSKIQSFQKKKNLVKDSREIFYEEIDIEIIDIKI